MINIDFNNLNPLEKKINAALMEAAKEESMITIDKAAAKEESMITIDKAALLCDCSMSKISKFVKKLGFNNYKQYINFICNQKIPETKNSSELERIKNFVDEFEIELVDKFINEINDYEKIIFFGYGPSYFCAQYFEYKLRIVTNKLVFSVPDMISVENLLDDKSMLVIFSATGSFASFEELYQFAKSKNSNFLLIIEEYNTAISFYYDKIYFLTRSFQSQELSPYEKSRTVFFIFIEEVIQRILEKNKLQGENT